MSPSFWSINYDLTGYKQLFIVINKVQWNSFFPTVGYPLRFKVSPSTSYIPITPPTTGSDTSLSGIGFVDLITGNAAFVSQDSGGSAATGFVIPGTGLVNTASNVAILFTSGNGDINFKANQGSILVYGVK
jgi:hypothetical protein